jgi:hypothetical protein
MPAQGRLAPPGDIPERRSGVGKSVARKDPSNGRRRNKTVGTRFLRFPAKVKVPELPGERYWHDRTVA